MRNYWSCTRFADWLRGTDKPTAETGSGWAQWRRASKIANPIRHWLAEEGLDLIQDVIMWPINRLYDIKYYINNRWVTKTHCLTAHPRDIKPGQWRDVGNRFLPCLFNELVDFVEIEQAWCHVLWDKTAREKYKTPWWGVGWFHWRVWRCPDAGIDYLKWSSELRADESWGLNPDDEGYGKLTVQAENAREILELYNWWKNVYPNRPDPYDASGWTVLCESRRARDPENFFDHEDRTPEEKQATKQALDLCNDIEQAYEQEDEAMMIRLIKIRNSLWT